MNTDTKALTTIRAIRARVDPILEYTVSNTLTTANKSPPDIVIRGRVETVTELPTDEPRRLATWGETAYHFQHSSLQNSQFVRNPTLAAAMIYTVERFMDTQHCAGIDTSAMPLSWSQLTADSDSDQDEIRNTVKTIRHALAWELNTLFSNSLYEKLPESLQDGVSKAFWKQPDPALTHHRLETTDNTPDTNSQTSAQTGLEDF